MPETRVPGRFLGLHSEGWLFEDFFSQVGNISLEPVLTV